MLEVKVFYTNLFKRITKGRDHPHTLEIMRQVDVRTLATRSTSSSCDSYAKDIQEKGPNHPGAEQIGEQYKDAANRALRLFEDFDFLRARKENCHRPPLPLPKISSEDQYFDLAVPIDVAGYKSFTGFRPFEIYLHASSPRFGKYTGAADQSFAPVWETEDSYECLGPKNGDAAWRQRRVAELQKEKEAAKTDEDKEKNLVKCSW